MDEPELTALLRRTGASIDVEVAPVETIAGRGRRRRRAWRAGRVVGGGVVLCGLVWAGVSLPLGGAHDPPPQTAGQGCARTVEPHVLPAWARGGFSDPRPVMPHVLGENGSIVAILWPEHLSSPPDPKESNKILWVARSPGDGLTDLVIRAHLEGTGTRVTRRVAGGPGPSIIDLPAPGCWRLDLAWHDHSDTVQLSYR